MRVRVVYRKGREKRRVLALAGALALLLLMAGVFMRREVVAQNVWVLGVPLAGLSGSDAVEAVSERVREIEEGPLEFVAGDRVFEVSSQEMAVHLDSSSLERGIEAYVASKSRFLPVSRLKNGPRKVLAAPAEFVSPDFDEVLDRVASALSVAPSAAGYRFQGRELIISPPTRGQVVTREDVRRALLALPGAKVEVQAQIVEAPASETVQELTLLAEFSTAYEPGKTDRNVNLALAAAAVHQWALDPGEVYSFNGAAGERTQEKGYRYAEVVVGDHLEPGLAGGICQVTTTLFNAAGKAGLNFREIHAHGIPVDYVPAGLDAAVAWNYLDLKIENNTEGPVVFGAWVEDSEVTVRVYGKARDSTYELEPVVLEEFPEEGKNPGLLVETYKVEKQGDKVVGKALVVRSLYLAAHPHPK